MRTIILVNALLVFSLTAFGQLPSYVPTDSLQGWWSFSGNANDSSGNGYYGIPTNVALSVDRFGVANCACIFDTIGDQISVPLQQNNILEYTVSAWFKTSNGGPLVSGRGANGEVGITLNIHNAFTGGEGKAQFIADGPAIAVGRQSDSTFDDDQWHHIVGVYSGSAGPVIPSQFQIYIDTILVSQFYETTGMANSPIYNNTIHPAS